MQTLARVSSRHCHSLWFGPDGPTTGTNLDPLQAAPPSQDFAGLVTTRDGHTITWTHPDAGTSTTPTPPTEQQWSAPGLSCLGAR